MSKTVFKVGMKVYDEVNFPKQELKVVKIADYNSDYPVMVKDTDGNEEAYTWGGRYFDHCIPTLSTTPYIVKLNGFSQGEPLKKGQIVWVRDDENDEWIIGHFIGMSSDEEHKYRVSSIPNRNGANWKFLTTKNPYENIE